MRFPVVVALVSVGSLTGCNLLMGYQPQYLCENRVRALCHFAFSCCNANERKNVGEIAFLTHYASEGDCIDDQLKYNGACTQGYAVQESVDEGRFEYDEELARTCNEELNEALNACDSEKIFDSSKLDTDNDCAEVEGVAYGKGLVKDGDKCFDAYECEDEGALCEIEQPEDPDKRNVTAVGECKAPHKEGEDCSEDFFCEPGTACDGNECVELKDNGDDCFIGSECKSGFCDPADAVCANEPDVDNDLKLNVEQCNGQSADDTDDF